MGAKPKDTTTSKSRKGRISLETSINSRDISQSSISLNNTGAVLSSGSHIFMGGLGQEVFYTDLGQKSS